MQAELLVVGDLYHARILSRHACREGLIHVESMSRIQLVGIHDLAGAPALSEGSWEPLHRFAERVAWRLHHFVMQGLCLHVSLFLPSPLLGEVLSKLSDAVTRALSGLVDVGLNDMASLLHVPLSEAIDIDAGRQPGI